MLIALIRRLAVAATVAGALWLPQLAIAGGGCGCGPTQGCGSGCGCASGGAVGDQCCCDNGSSGLLGRLTNSGCHGGCHLGHGRGLSVEGTDPNFNCGCNGSYKYPVPPLYTYFWRGMYSHQLMTDYHIPYRFPPLRPYVDENLPPELDPYAPREPGIAPPAPLTVPPAAPLDAAPIPPAEEGVAPIRYRAALRPGQVEPLSEKMKRLYR